MRGNAPVLGKGCDGHAWTRGERCGSLHSTCMHVAELREQGWNASGCRSLAPLFCSPQGCLWTPGTNTLVVCMLGAVSLRWPVCECADPHAATDPPGAVHLLGRQAELQHSDAIRASGGGHAGGRLVSSSCNTKSVNTPSPCTVAAIHIVERAGNRASTFSARHAL